MSANYLNYLSADRLVFDVVNLPDFSFTVQTHNIPGVSIPAAKQPTPIVDIPRFGDKIINEPLLVTFIVTEDLENWLEIRNWITANASQIRREGQKAPFGAVDVTITAYDSSNNPVGKFKFIGAVPTTLSGIDNTVKTAETTYMTATVQMEFESFDFTSEV